MEFDKAKYGTLGLESAFGVLQTVLPVEIIVEKLVRGRAVFGQETISITEGQKANITLFNPEGESIFTKENILSKSKNSAFLGTKTNATSHLIQPAGKRTANRTGFPSQDQERRLKRILGCMLIVQ